MKKWLWGRGRKPALGHLGEALSEQIERMRFESGLPRSPMPKCKEPRKVWPCADCSQVELEVFDVDGRDFCADCLIQRVRAFNAMMNDAERYLGNWNYKK
jgi:hypothetical protein